MPQQLDIFNKTKEENAIQFIQDNIPMIKVRNGWVYEPYFLGFSGGKDSVVLYDLTVKSGVPFEAYYSCTGLDAPELVKFIKKNYPDVTFKYPKKSFFKAIREGKQFPTKFRRWCCDDLKKHPTKSVPLKNRLMGIRAEESSMRARRPNPDYYDRMKQWTYKPIFGWEEWEVWDYIDRYELPYSELYDEGFSRLGCVVCPYLCRANQFQLLKHKNRWPKIYHAFELAMTKYFEIKGDQLREETAEELINNWYHGNAKPPGEEVYLFNLKLKTVGE